MGWNHQPVAVFGAFCWLVLYLLFKLNKFASEHKIINWKTNEETMSNIDYTVQGCPGQLTYHTYAKGNSSSILSAFER